MASNVENVSIWWRHHELLAWINFQNDKYWNFAVPTWSISYQQNSIVQSIWKMANLYNTMSLYNYHLCLIKYHDNQVQFVLPIDKIYTTGAEAGLHR